MANGRLKAAPGPIGVYKHEVLVRRDGRWTIDCVVDDVAEARNRAEELVNSGSCQEAKVMRWRQQAGREGFSSELLHLQARKKTEKAYALAGDPTKAPACVAVGDLFRWQTRRFLAVLLRRYLQENNLIPSELLFDWRHAKRLLDSGSLAYDAVCRVAATQAERDGDDSTARIKALDGLVQEAAKLCAEFSVRRRSLFSGASPWEGMLPALDSNDKFVARALATSFLSDGLARIAHLEAKLEALLDLLPNAEEPWFSCVEEMVAECLLFGQSHAVLFRQTPNRMARIQRLADLVEGRDSAPAVRGCPSLVALAELIQQSRAPHCASVLETWLPPLIGSREPLDHTNPSKEVRLIELLSRRLQRSDGRWIGGEGVGKAFEMRRTRAREETLRGLGMDSAADALGRAAARS